MPTKVICTPCGGRGFVEVLYRCPCCNDKELVKEKCKKCDGRGWAEELTFQERRLQDGSQTDSGSPAEGR